MAVGVKVGVGGDTIWVSVTQTTVEEGSGITVGVTDRVNIKQPIDSNVHAAYKAVQPRRDRFIGSTYLKRYICARERRL